MGGGGWSMKKRSKEGKMEKKGEKVNLVQV